MKKAVFFDPYLNTLGGGERYFFTLASYLAKKNWQVDIFGFARSISKKAEDRFGIDLKRVNFLDKDLSRLNLAKKRKILLDYDFSFWVSDGSIPWLFARRNILHFQVPFHDLQGKSFANRLKFGKIDLVVCNSFFTKKFIDQEYAVDSLVIYPPVSVDQFGPARKKNLILSVGRFTDLLHNKRQGVLIEAFKRLVDDGERGYRFVLAGADSEGKSLVKKLKKMSLDYPIEIKTNISFAELRSFYAWAKIFWVATGFGLNEDRYPERVEHFGMTTVEAMAAGCVPVVIDKGGQREIVEEGKNGFLWQTRQDLVKSTKKLIEDKELLGRLSDEARKKSRQFSQKAFCENYEKIIG